MQFCSHYNAKINIDLSLQTSYLLCIQLFSVGVDLKYDCVNVCKGNVDQTLIAAVLNGGHIFNAIISMSVVDISTHKDKHVQMYYSNIHIHIVYTNVPLQ